VWLVTPGTATLDGLLLLLATRFAILVLMVAAVMAWRRRGGLANRALRSVYFLPLNQLDADLAAPYRDPA
jgi:hypothetical protein